MLLLVHPIAVYILTTYYDISDLQSKSNTALDGTGSECIVGPSQAPILPNSVNYTKSDSNMSSTWDNSEYIYPILLSTNVHCGDPFWFDGCTANYCAKEHAATEHAGKIMSIPYLISSISSPFLGHMVDKVGRRAVLATVASAILLLVHLSLALTNISPVGPMILQGTAYSLYAAVIWPSVPLTVSKQYTGTAYGVITSIQNMGLALFPLIIAGIYNINDSYVPNVEIFFTCCASAGVIVGLLMIRVDRRSGGKLNAISTERKEEYCVTDTENLRQTLDYFDPLATETDPIHLD
jgi:MFS family permease